jgi:hypothetical protein
MRNVVIGSIVALCACHGPNDGRVRSSDDATLRAAPVAKMRPPIIDMHMHADLPPHDVPAGAPALCRPEPCQGRNPATANHAETREKSLEAMDRYNIVKAILSGRDPEIVQQWVAAAPGRFIAAPFILRPGEPAPEMLRREHAAGRIAGIGEIATQLTGVAPNDPALEPYFAMAEELDLPVLIHTLGIGPYLPEFRVAAGSPLLLEDVLVRHPKLRQTSSIITRHASSVWKDSQIRPSSASQAGAGASRRRARERRAAALACAHSSRWSVPVVCARGALAWAIGRVKNTVVPSPS